MFGRKAASCSINAALVSTTRASRLRPAPASRRWASSASQASSSRIRIRLLGPAESGPPPVSAFACLGTVMVSGWPGSGSPSWCSPLMDVLPQSEFRRDAGDGLIQEQPEHAEGLDRFGEFGELYWLSDIRIGAVAVANQDVLFQFGAGQDDHRDHLRPLVGSHPAQNLKPADLREIQVEQNESRSRRVVAVALALALALALAGEEVRQSLGAVSLHDDLVVDVALVEGPQGQCLVVGIVLYQQDGSA